MQWSFIVGIGQKLKVKFCNIYIPIIRIAFETV